MASRKALHSYPPAAEKLAVPARTVTEFYVPGTGHGTTTDKDQAVTWAVHRSELEAGVQVPVLARTITYPAWTVSTNCVAANVEE